MWLYCKFTFTDWKWISSRECSACQRHVNKCSPTIGIRNIFPFFAFAFLFLKMFCVVTKELSYCNFRHWTSGSLCLGCDQIVAMFILRVIENSSSSHDVLEFLPGEVVWEEAQAAVRCQHQPVGRDELEGRPRPAGDLLHTLCDDVTTTFSRTSRLLHRSGNLCQVREYDVKPFLS